MGVMYPDASAVSQIAVTPNDNVDLPGGSCRALEVLVGGNIVCIAATDPDAGAITRTGYLAGTIIPISIRRVKATGTTATVLALY
jgi:hypothetical protein